MVRPASLKRVADLEIVADILVVVDLYRDMGAAQRGFQFIGLVDGRDFVGGGVDDERGRELGRGVDGRIAQKEQRVDVGRAQGRDDQFILRR